MAKKINVIIAFDNETIQLSESDILELTWSNNLMDSDLNMNPGICEQNASVRFYDRYQTITERFAGGQSTACSVTINVLDGDDYIETIDYIGSEFNLENDGDVVQLSLTDNTKLFDNIVVPQALVKNRTAHQLLTEFFNCLPSGSWQYYDLLTEQRCKSITVPNSWYREGTLKEFLNKICVLGLLRIFCVSDKFYVARCV